MFEQITNIRSVWPKIKYLFFVHPETPWTKTNICSLFVTNNKFLLFCLNKQQNNKFVLCDLFLGFVHCRFGTNICWTNFNKITKNKSQMFILLFVRTNLLFCSTKQIFGTYLLFVICYFSPGTEIWNEFVRCVRTK